MFTDVAQEIEAVYRRYLHEYPRRVQDELAGVALDLRDLNFWQFPLLICMTQHSALIDHATFASTFSSSYRDYRARGWAGKIALDDIQVSVATPNWASFAARGTRFEQTGEVIDGWHTTYLMRRRVEGWRCFALAPAPADGASLSQWREWLLHLAD